MPTTNQKERRTRELAMMYCIARKADKGHACLGRKELAAVLNISPYQVSYTTRALINAGFIEVHERFAPNGARLENAYSLTPMGKRTLAYWS